MTLAIIRPQLYLYEKRFIFSTDTACQNISLLSRWLQKYDHRKDPLGIYSDKTCYNISGS